MIRSCISGKIGTILAAGAIAVSLTPIAYGQQTEDKTNKPVNGVRAATKEEMNGGKHYLGMNRPSSLPDNAQLTPDAVQFAKKAAMDSAAEVKLGQLAEQRASSDAVKQFARQMIEDHTKANEQLSSLASDKGLTLPTTLDAKHQALYNKLSRLEGAAFDRAYMKAMVDDHKKAVKMFTARANNGRNTDLRSWTATTLPTLRKHLEMAQDIYGTVSGQSASTGHSSNR